MVITNKATEIGDVLCIKTDIPLIGIVMLLSFTDETVGETGSRLFSKTFRYSVDGINWSPFVPLTNDNIAGVDIQANDTFFAEYLYTRIGSDASGDLEFDSVTLNGEFITSDDGPAYLASNFASFFNQNNICSTAWSVNVLEKLYKKGIVPDYIERNISGDNATDRDYIDFWRAITHYFALYVCLARQFQFFYQNRDLLLEYVKQRGLFVCDDTSTVDLFYLMEFYYDEIRQRGTRQVFEKKAIDTSIDGSKQVDGEYLRMICYDLEDEFIRNLNRNEHIGWNVGNSSPLYQGLEDRLNTNKYYIDYVDDIYNFSELSIDPTYLPYLSIGENSNSNSISSSNSNSDSTPTTVDNDVIIVSNPGSGNEAGIGNGDKKIIINPNIDYEITFFAKSRITNTQQITFGVNVYDKNDNALNLLEINTLTTNNDFFVQETLNQADKYYFVRGVLFNKNNYKAYSSLKEYESNTIVSYLGNYYKSKRLVPLNGEVVDLGTINTTPGISLGTNPILWNFWQLLTSDEVSQNFTTNLGVGNNLLLVDNAVKIDPYILLTGGGSTTYTDPNPVIISIVATVTPFSITIKDTIHNNSIGSVAWQGSTNATMIALVNSVNNNIAGIPPLFTAPPFNNSWGYTASWNNSTNRLTIYAPLNSGSTYNGGHIALNNSGTLIITNIAAAFIGGVTTIGSGNELYLYDIRVQPLSTEYSKGFIQATNLLEVWSTNNNQNISENRVELDTKHYLIPYNAILKSNFIPSEIN